MCAVPPRAAAESARSSIVKKDIPKFSHQAMATTFQVIIDGQDHTYARQAADAAFAEADRMEQFFSRFIDSSDVSRLNHAPVDTWINVSLETFECLKIASAMTETTAGAFDVTIGPLLALWKKAGDTGAPAPADIEAARRLVGMGHVHLDAARVAVRMDVEGVQVDLGGIGKGYAGDRMVAVLQEWDIEAALVNAGFSTVCAFGAPEGEEGWPSGVGGVGDEEEAPEAVILKNRALSGSGSHIRGRHIMDPRTGKAATAKAAVWATHPRGAEADALSTAFMVMSVEEVKAYCAKHPETSALLVVPEGQGTKALHFGAW